MRIVEKVISAEVEAEIQEVLAPLRQYLSDEDEASVFQAIGDRLGIPDLRVILLHAREQELPMCQCDDPIFGPYDFEIAFIYGWLLIDRVQKP